MENKKRLNIYQMHIIILLLICAFFIVLLVNYQRKSDAMIRDKFHYNIRNFNLIMDDYENDINKTNDIYQELDIIKKLGLRLDNSNYSLDYREFNNNFKKPITPLVYYLLEINLETFEKNDIYRNEVLNNLNEVYLISSEILKMPINTFFENNKFNIFNKIKPNDKLVDYFEQINSIVAAE
ncbi:MAG: hypothetical protein RSA29_14255 [Clostridium sp.]|uniref:hypothetical protein n=1 Tax=Clostridium sp. TaxID=1506 RepID=UPI0032180320